MDEKITRLSRVVDAILAAFLIALIFAFSFKTIYPHFKALYNSTRLMSRLEGYLPDDYDALDLLSARIQSFEKTFGEKLWHQEELSKINAGIQISLGKNMITTGEASMVKLPTGDLYDIQMPIDITDRLDEIVRFAAQLDVPFTYVYEHPTNYGDDKLTGGYAQLDWGEELGDQIVSTLRDAGVEVIDSRAALEGIPSSELVLRTDQHWTPFAALNVARVVANDLGLDASMLDPEAFESETFPEKFLGKYGQRIGASRVVPDDFTVYWPGYETNISRYTIKVNGVVEEASGSFHDAVIKWENLEGEGWNMLAYRALGLTETFEHFHNDAAPDISILVYKDSYGSPIGSYLSLVARDVYLVDMRQTDRDALEFVEELQPDKIVMAYSRQMVVLHEYRLFHEK
jgi:hypothetical protein